MDDFCGRSIAHLGHARPGGLQCPGNMPDRCEHGYQPGRCAIAQACPNAPADDPLGLSWARK